MRQYDDSEGEGVTTRTVLIPGKLELDHQTILRAGIEWLKLDFFMLGESLSMEAYNTAGILFKTKEGGGEVAWDGVQCSTTGFGTDLSVPPPDIHVPLISQFTYENPVFFGDQEMNWNYRSHGDTTCTDYVGIEQCRRLKCTVYRSFYTDDRAEDLNLKVGQSLMTLAFAETVRTGGLQDERVWNGPQPTELQIQNTFGGVVGTVELGNGCFDISFLR